MFQSEPDPSWHYAQLWAELKETYFKLKEIEMKLSHPDAENQNDDVDKFVMQNLQTIWGIANNLIYGDLEIFQEDKEEK
jgi:hypothetical protein